MVSNSESIEERGNAEESFAPLTNQYPKPVKPASGESTYTKITDEDLKKGFEDEYGALYSRYGLRLLKGPDCPKYSIRQGTIAISDNAFSMCISLSSLTIPNSVTHIGNYAFSLCRRLSSILIPDSVTYIGSNPFIFSSVKNIECNNPFFEFEGHALYTKGKERIIAFLDYEAFYFSIPNTVTHIGDRAFSGCIKLSSISIPNSVTRIGNNAFDGCYRLYSIKIPNSVTYIGDDAFSWCKRLSSISIPNSVTYIGKDAFYACRRLSSITIPHGSREKFMQLLSHKLHKKLIEQ